MRVSSGYVQNFIGDEFQPDLGGIVPQPWGSGERKNRFDEMQLPPDDPYLPNLICALAYRCNARKNI